MNSRSLAIIGLALVAAVALVPLADGADAATSQDIELTLPGDDTGTTVHVEVGSGGSEMFRIYVYNKSDDYLMLTASGSSGSVLSASFFRQMLFDTCCPSALQKAR